MSIVGYREDLAERILTEIAERRGGRLPRKAKHLLACIEQFGARVRWMPRELLPEPLLRNGVVLLPDVRGADGKIRGRTLTRWLAHELAEVVLSWEGTRSYQGPGWSGDRHRVAAKVEAALVRSASGRCPRPE